MKTTPCRYCGYPLIENPDPFNPAPNVCDTCLIDRLAILIKREGELPPDRMKRELIAIGITEEWADYLIKDATFWHGNRAGDHEYQMSLDL